MKNCGFKANDAKKASAVFKLSVVMLVSLSILLGTVFRGYGTGLFVNALNENMKNTVIIDAGHGGEDCGAIGKNGVYEKDLNLAISFMLGEELEKLGVSVVYTRTEDKMLYSEEENVKGLRKISDLKNRVKIAREHPDAIFVSVHMNSFGDSRYSGLQVYYSPNSSDSRVLADSVQTAVKDGVQNKNNRVIKDGKSLYLMKNLEIPAILIECGFLSNLEECEKLSEKEYKKLLSFSIVCGIINYMEEKNSGSTEK